MKENSHFRFINATNKSFKGGLCINRIIIIIILFLFNSLCAQQQHSSPSDTQPTTISLSNGAEIYSLDKSFNDQVSAKKIILKNGNVSFVTHKNHKILVASSSNNPRHQNLAKQVKDFEEKKKKKAQKDLQITIDDYKAQSKLFTQKDFNHLPSPSQFFSSHSSLKNYVTPNDNGSGFSKIGASSKDYSIKCALNYLHTQKNTYYNNKSLDYCFSHVFSVRPPPVLA